VKYKSVERARRRYRLPQQCVGVRQAKKLIDAPPSGEKH
jgi:hypothetical protein